MTRIDITTVEALLDWLAQRLRQAEPQRPVSNSLLILFDEMLAELKKDDCAAWTLSSRNLLQALEGPTETCIGYGFLANFIADCCDHAVFMDGEATALFIRFAARDTGLGGDLLFSDDELHGSLDIVSSPRLEARENIHVRVTMPLPIFY